MSSINLIDLIHNLKDEYNIYYSLRKKFYSEKNDRKNVIRKAEIKEEEQIILKISEDINKYVDKYLKLIILKEEINKEKQKEKDILDKKSKLYNFLEKGKSLLINNIAYYKNLPRYANKKLKTAEISPLDLINFTLRISQQNKAPLDFDLYFQNYLPYNFNASLMYNKYFIKNQNRFLYPYPNNFFGFKSTILRYNLSDKNRILPPLLKSPDPKNVNQNNKIVSVKGADLVFKYPDENPPPDIFYKFSKVPNVIPSFFSGEEYNDHLRPSLNSDCRIKVCSCRNGFKDSKIVTFEFSVNTDEEIIYHEKEGGIKGKGNVMNRPENDLDVKGEYFGLMSPASYSPEANTSRQGSSAHKPAYFDPASNNDDEDEDDIDI